MLNSSGSAILEKWTETMKSTQVVNQRTIRSHGRSRSIWIQNTKYYRLFSPFRIVLSVWALSTRDSSSSFFSVVSDSNHTPILFSIHLVNSLWSGQLVIALWERSESDGLTELIKKERKSTCRMRRRKKSALDIQDKLGELLCCCNVTLNTRRASNQRSVDKNNTRTGKIEMLFSHSHTYTGAQGKWHPNNHQNDVNNLSKVDRLSRVAMYQTPIKRGGITRSV